MSLAHDFQEYVFLPMFCSYKAYCAEPLIYTNTNRCVLEQCINLICLWRSKAGKEGHGTVFTIITHFIHNKTAPFESTFQHLSGQATNVGFETVTLSQLPS